MSHLFPWKLPLYLCQERRLKETNWCHFYSPFTPCFVSNNRHSFELRSSGIDCCGTRCFTPSSFKCHFIVTSVFGLTDCIWWTIIPVCPEHPETPAYAAILHWFNNYHSGKMQNDQWLFSNLCSRHRGKKTKRGAICLLKIAPNDTSWEKQQQAEATLGCQWAALNIINNGTTPRLAAKNNRKKMLRDVEPVCICALDVGFMRPFSEIIGSAERGGKETKRAEWVKEEAPVSGREAGCNDGVATLWIHSSTVKS